MDCKIQHHTCITEILKGSFEVECHFSRLQKSLLIKVVCVSPWNENLNFKNTGPNQVLEFIYIYTLYI